MYAQEEATLSNRLFLPRMFMRVIVDTSGTCACDHQLHTLRALEQPPSGSCAQRTSTSRGAKQTRPLRLALWCLPKQASSSESSLGCCTCAKQPST